MHGHYYSAAASLKTICLDLHAKVYACTLIHTHNHMIFYYVMRITASAWFALGIDLDLTKEDNEEAKRFQQSIQTFIRSVDYMVQAIPIYKIYPTKKYTEAKESLAAVRLLGRKYVERNRTAIEKRLREGGSTHDGLSLIEQWMIEGNMSEEQCIISALDMFAAGVDTVSVGLCMLHEYHQFAFTF